MKINIQAIPHSKHRYPTVGDYWENANGSIQIRVSDMGNLDYEFLVALHELIEQHLCAKRGIQFEDIDQFDKAFEEVRPPGNFDEPGDDTGAPYYREHQFATKIERLMAEELGIDWDVYENVVENL